MRLSSGTRGTIPSDAYSALLIGWAVSVDVARTSPGSPPAAPPPTRASSARPTPAAWTSGSTKHIDRNHSRSRTDRGGERDDPLVAGSSGSAWVADDEPLGVGRLEVRVEAEQRTGLGRDLGLVQPAM